MTDAADERRYRRILFGILVAAAVIRIGFAVVTPAWQAPDEYAHFWIAQQIAHEGQLPMSTPTFPEYESFQPPLYYCLAALPLRMFPGAVEFSLAPQAPPAALVAVRLLSVLFSVMTIWVAYRLFRLMPRLRPVEALWGVGVMSCLPTFVGTGATVTNDALVILPSAIGLWLLYRPGWSDRRAVWVGVWAGLAVLTKMNGLVLLPLVALRIHQVSAPDSRQFFRRLLLVGYGWALPVALLVIRNIMMYDDWLALVPGVPKGSGLTLANAIRAIRNLNWSFWLAFGRGYKIQLAPAGYLLTALPMMLLAGVGLMRNRERRRELLWPAGLAVASGLVGSLCYTFAYPPGSMTSWGKNMFPVLPMIVLLLVTGWRSVGARHPAVAPALSVATLICGCAWGLWKLAALV